MAGAFPGFCSMKQLRVLLISPEWDASPSQGYSQRSLVPIYVAGNYLSVHLGGERQCEAVSCLRKQHDGSRPTELQI